MSYSINKLTAIDMATGLIANKQNIPDMDSEQQNLFSDIETLLNSAVMGLSLTEQLKTIKAALEGS